MGLANARVPTVVASSIVAFVIGIGAGMALEAVTGIGQAQGTRTFGNGPEMTAKMGGGPGMAGSGGGGPGIGGGKMGGMGAAKTGGGMGMGGGGFRGPSPKLQLASLVTKLSLLTGESLSLALSDEQKKKVQESIQGLEEPAELSDDEAKKRLDALLESLKGHRETLEAVGYRWPAEGSAGGFRPPADVPNPFKEEKNAAGLKSLREQTAPAKKT